ncbi:M16 family metallopeptidase [Paludisphaera borealis]|uniref:Putative zinc protease n=1 Tax=Paludisphaera borealis TaxID=1387353 RepID=A0A1U7CL21_9BACT|nr:pitrilysin family protein [Paludisphaera borealis]APW59632.1 putative zinc protease [Paludisphaera borealis]
MKSIVVAAVLAAFVVPSARSGEAADAPVFAYPIRTTVLDNGLGVVSVPFDSPGVVAYYTVVRTGSRNEVEPGLSGFAHFFEHMMFRGTERYSQEQYNDVLKSLGADSNAFTTDDWTCYHMTIPASALATAVDVEADRFQNLKYDEAAFQKEARAVLGEYNKSASSPFLKLEEAISNTAFTRHTYKHTTIGFLADVKDMPNQFAYSKVFFDRWYRPENCTIVVVGQVDHDQLLGLAKTHYGSWRRGTEKVEIPVEPPQAEARSVKLTWPSPTLPILALAYHIPASNPADPDVPALHALREAVFGETSPLYKALVLDEQKAESLPAYADPHRDPSLFTILARGRKPEDVVEIRKRVTEAVAAAVKTPIGADRLKAIQSNLRYRFAGELDSPDAAARAVAESIAITGKPDAMNTLHAAYGRLTPADLQRVAARYFTSTNETAVTLETENP